MALSFTKKQRERVKDVLMDESLTTADEAVEAVLSLLDELVAARASWVVVAQLSSTRERGTLAPSDPEAIKVALGFYSTEGDARAASDQLWSNVASGDTFRRWVLPMYHGTPTEFHKEQREKYAADEAKRKEADAARIQKQIQTRQAEAEQRAKDIRAREAAAGGQPWPCFANRIKAGACRHQPECK